MRNEQILRNFRAEVEQAINEKWQRAVRELIERNKADQEQARGSAMYCPEYFEGSEEGLQELLERMEASK